jgi:membrane-associated phospholipid phosphatase
MVLVVLYGPVTSLLLIGAAPIALSRLALGRHEPLEVAVGFLYGLASMTALSWLVGLW